MGCWVGRQYNPHSDPQSCSISAELNMLARNRCCAEHAIPATGDIAACCGTVPQAGQPAEETAGLHNVGPCPAAAETMDNQGRQCIEKGVLLASELKAYTMCHAQAPSDTKGHIQTGLDLEALFASHAMAPAGILRLCLSTAPEQPFGCAFGQLRRSSDSS